MTAGAILVLATAAAGLESGFLRPPDSAKPHTWYHMMNGNVTKAGITRDFEALADAGFGGVQMFDAGCSIPPGDLLFNTPEWFDLFKHAASEGRRLGLEICIPNCSGWSSSGGPWNPPSNGMKRVVFSETRVKGPRRFSGALPRERDDHGFYEDVAVVAFPLPPAETAGALPVPAVSTPLAAPPDAAAKLTDGSRGTVLEMNRSGDGNTVTLTYPAVVTATGFDYQLEGGDGWEGDNTDITVEISRDGTSFTQAAKLRISTTYWGAFVTSMRSHVFDRPLSFKAVRFKFDFIRSGVAQEFRLGELKPVAYRRISNIEGKTFATTWPVAADETPAAPGQTVDRAAVRTVAAGPGPFDTVEWDVPPGEWILMRVGFVCNGKCNHPASRYGVGLEVDKLSAAAMNYHFEQYVARLCRTLGPLAGRVESGFNNILVDSYEVGGQNWTQGFEREFKRRRGYDILQYLPAFAGRVIGSVEETERFLEDFRRVVADMFAENYAGALAAKCHEYGLMCSIEPYGCPPADHLQYGQYVDIPMAEFWSCAADPYAAGDGNARFAAQIAHVWGRRLSASESFTAWPSAKCGRWMTTPFSIKAQGDLAYSDGINRIIYHRFTHQPWPNDSYLPGMTMGRWGMHLDRTQTWWNYAKPFFRYQARCQFMLQRGEYVGDVLYFEGEAAPNTGSGRDGLAEGFSFTPPAGYDGDTCPTDAMYALKVANGEIVAPGGVRYRALVLPPLTAVSPKMLRNVLRLLRDGAAVVWSRGPDRAPGLASGAGGDAEVRRLADIVFSSGALAMPVEAALRRLGVEPQVAWTPDQLPPGVKNVNWIHRREDGAEWFFVAAPLRDPAEIEMSFRVRGLEPEIWDAESGEMSVAAVWREERGRTVVRVPLDVSGSKFVVFRKKPSADRFASAEITKASPGIAVPLEFKRGDDGTVKTWAWTPLEATVVESGGAVRRLAAEPPPPVAVDGPWEVSFPNKFLPNAMASGPDEKVAFGRLVSWSERPEPGVKYFSGSAVYRKKFALPASAPAGARIVLDLGEVREVAKVTVNGREYDALWRPPFRLDITDAVKNGPVDLAVSVANLWANRLIGDDILHEPDCEWTGSVVKGVKEIALKKIPEWVKAGKPSPTGRCTFTTWKHWDKHDALLPSGLLGPVRLRVITEAR
ncbi:MAG: hypothetical protein J6T01_00600 [Kiritimatiellae bacterium]|nr:hypothetical protein [Kiritimatiellia bacterium]